LPRPNPSHAGVVVAVCEPFARIVQIAAIQAAPVAELGPIEESRATDLPRGADAEVRAAHIAAAHLLLAGRVLPEGRWSKVHAARSTRSSRSSWSSCALSRAFRDARSST